MWGVKVKDVVFCEFLVALVYLIDYSDGTKRNSYSYLSLQIILSQLIDGG